MFQKSKLLKFFYRAVLCIAHTMLSQDVCPSVCQDLVLCQNGSTYRRNSLTIWYSNILVF